MSLVNALTNYLLERFGIQKEVFKDYEIIEDKDLWITSKMAAEFQIKFWSRKGICIARVFKNSFKFTTDGMHIFGKYATKNVVHINDEELDMFLKGDNIKIDAPVGIEEGQVIVKYKDDVIGSAIYKNGILKNQLPKGRRVL